MTEVPVCESLRCVFFIFFFFFLFSFLCDSWLGSGSSCLLEVVASSAGEEVGAYGSQDSHQVVSAQSNKENKRRQSSICCKRLQTLGLFDLSVLLLFLLSLFLNSCDT